MDRIIALLAAFVALIALAGALMVQRGADAAMARQSLEIATLREALSRSADASQPSQAAADLTSVIDALESRLASLEAGVATISAAPPAEEPVPVEAAQLPAQSAQPAILAAGGPTEDCIPLGTRFVAQTGDSFAICGTPVVVEVTSVTEGSVLVAGAGPVTAGGFANLPAQGCTIMVFTADMSGFTEMRVTCT
jgi:uncharacterized Zn-binding protein involved in type VI secretion